MPRTSEPARRALRALKVVRRCRAISTAEVARHLGCGDKDMVRRDLDLLALEGLIERVGEGHDASWIDASVDPPLPAALEEIALVLGRERTSFLALGLLSHSLDPERSRWDRKFWHHAEPTRTYSDHRTELEALLRALLAERRVGLRYPVPGETRTLDVAPLSLVLYRRALYLLAQSTDGEVHRIAVDRVRDVALGEPFVYPEDWSPQAELATSFGIAKAGPVETVELRFDPDVANYVTSRQWHPSQEIRREKDGSVVLRMTVAGHELVRFVCEWGPTVEVVAPTSLRNKVRGELSAALRVYRSD